MALHRHALRMMLLLPIAGCATAAVNRGVVHTAPDESQPHISWELRTGGDSGQREFVCGSSQPSRPCALPASTERRQTVATIHLMVHAAAEPTSYLGFMLGGFFEGGSDRRIGEVNTTVAPGSRPVSTTVTGLVTSKPGTQSLAISIDATQPKAPAPQRIAEKVPVFVK
jgi:hypothetical protein